MDTNVDAVEEGGLRRIFARSAFDHEKYVKNIIKNGDAEINKSVALINKMTDETSTSMKKAIFNNYNLFIDAGKAVYQLESSMHQMHHHLKEQKRLLNSLCDVKLFFDTGTNLTADQIQEAEQKEEEDSRTTLASLLERVEGSTHVAAVPKRCVLLEGDLNELNSETFSPMQVVRAFLMNDAFFTATILPQKRGPVRYKFQALYELDSMAVVNIRERDGQATPNRAFKIMVFPDNRIFQTETSKEKKVWIDNIDKAKKKKASENSRKRESTLVHHSPILSTNPFEEYLSQNSKQDSISDTGKSQPDKKSFISSHSNDPIMPLMFETWILEAPEDLDVCLAERNLSGAVDLIEKVQVRLQEMSETLCTSSLSSNASDISTARNFNSARLAECKSRIDQRAATLCETLQQELVTGAERHGGVRSVRQTVTQLIRLGKSSLACQLFLHYRSAVLTHRMQQVKQEGSQNLYVVKLSFAFHRGIFETGYEFKTIFKKNRNFTSRFCAWCCEESNVFADKLRLLLIESRSVSFYAMALAIEHINAHSEKVTESLGVDITFNLDSSLIECWKRAAEDQARVLKDSLDMRASEESWRRIKFESSKESDKFFTEMKNAKITNIESFSSSGNRLNLTSSTCQFAKSLVLFAESLGRLGCQELHFVFSNCLADLLAAELKHYKRVLSSKQFIEKRNFIINNLNFLSSIITPKVESYLPCSNCPAFVDVKNEIQSVLAEGKGYSV